MKKMRKSLVLKSMASIILMLTLFAAIISVIGYRGFSKALYDQYTDGAFRIADAAALTIDADRLDAYWESEGASEEYQAVWKNLDDLCNASGATFIYVIEPDLTDYGEITFLFSTVNRDSIYTPYEVGFVRQTTNDEYRVKYRALYTGEMDRALLLLQGGKYTAATYHITAMIPLKGTDGQTKAILCVQRQMDAIARVRQAYVRDVLWVLIILTLIAVNLVGFYLSRSLILPIKTITEEASRFASENVTVGQRLTETIRNEDEIGVLADSIDRMEEQITSYVENLTRITAEKERIGTELGMARQIQASMMPSIFPAFPDRQEFDIYATMEPAKEVGGDFYDFFLIDDDHLCMVMADVSGKGIPAALFMMVTKVILQSCAMLGKSAVEILTKTNEALCSNNTYAMFVTIWVGILEISTGKLTAANAGHEYPVVKNAGDSFKILRDKHGFVIGGMSSAKYTEYELQLKPGTKLFVYTDGVPEATNADGKMFGTDRMLAALNHDPAAEPKQILKNVRKSIDSFVQGAEKFDDLTMLCLEYKGTESAVLPPDALAVQ